MPGYHLSAAARADLLAIAAYTRDRWGTQQALAYTARLEEAFALLTKMPRLGRLFLGLGRRYRRLQAGRHAIFYRTDADGVFIVRVLHERMIPARYLSE